MSILGERRAYWGRIAFVNRCPSLRSSNSLDLSLYDVIFPGLSVVPKGNCVDVQKAVSGMRGSKDYHHVETFGLIDRDDRNEDVVTELSEKGVFALDVYSVEALYYSCYSRSVRNALFVLPWLN